MNKKKNEILLDAIDNNDGYISVQEAKEIGIERTYLFSLEEDGYLRKVARGLYLKKGIEPDPYYLLHFIYKKAVFSLGSSAFLHGLIKEDPVLSVNLPPNYMTAGIAGANARHVGDKEYNLGLSLAVSPRGTLVPCYDLERTIIDLLRYRSLYPDDVWNEALRIAFSKKPYEQKLRDYAYSFHYQDTLEVVQKIFA